MGKVFETKIKAHLESLKCLAAPEAKEKHVRHGHCHYQSRGVARGGGADTATTAVRGREPEAFPPLQKSRKRKKNFKRRINNQ